MKDSKQMDFFPSTSSQEDTLANLSLSQVIKKVSKIRDTSGQKCLDLSKSSDRLGLLEKTLVDTLNSVSTPYSRTWKVKTTPQGRLVFQLLASVPTTKEKESGLWLTPSKTIISNRSPEAMEKRKKFRESIGRKTVNPGNLAEQIQYGNKTTDMKLWPTPTANEDAAGKPTGKMQKMLGNHPEVRKPLGGGTLNPMWVEWLMGYPIGFTDLNHLETVLFHKSPTTSDSVSSNRLMWPTPAARSFQPPRKPETMAKTGRNPLTNTLEDAVQHREIEKRKNWPTPTSTDGQRGDVKNLDGYRRRKEKWKKKGVNIHKPLDVAVALDEEKKNVEDTDSN